MGGGGLGYIPQGLQRKDRRADGAVVVALGPVARSAAVSSIRYEAGVVAMSPTRPGRPCATPGCPLIVHGASHCPAHEQTRRYKPEEQRRFYNSTRWKKLRAIVRAQEPICRICFTNPSTSVDHIDGDWQNNERSNLRAVCTSCEKTRTAVQHRRKANG